MPTTHSLVFNGKTYSFSLTRKPMRRITMRAEHGLIAVHAPAGIPLSSIRATLTQHMEKLVPLLEKEPPCAKDHVYFMGWRYDNDAPYLKTIFKTPLNDFDAPAVKQELRSKAVTLFTSRVRHYEMVMGVKKPYLVKVRTMKARLGTNAKTSHALTFAVSLIHYSLAIIDAVIVHELAHDFAFDHSPNFYAIVRRYYPSYKQEHDKIRQGVYR